MNHGIKKLVPFIAGTWCAGLLSAQAAVVDVYAEPATNYGNSGTFVCPVTLTGGETFDIRFDVTASETTHEIESGYSSVSSPTTAWGLGLASGDDNNNDDVFNGDLDLGVYARINNLRIENFLSNSGSLTVDDITGLSFDSVTISDAPSIGDRVTVISEGVTNAFLRLSVDRVYAAVDGNYAVIDLEGVAGSGGVGEFELTTSTEASNNKWACCSIQVQYQVPDSALTLDAESLSLELNGPDTSVDGAFSAGIDVGSSSNNVEVISLAADSGFSAVISDSTLTPATSNETVTVTYTNSGELVEKGDAAASTLTITWTAAGSGLTNTTDVALDVTFTPEVVLASTVVDVFAVATTNYGVDAVATMYSEVQTASDGLATYQIAIDVDPMDGGGIVSGNVGASTTTQSWGIDDGMFRGSLTNYVDLVDNVRIVNFNANGGSLTVDDFQDLSFASVTIADAQSTDDRVLAVANGITNSADGVKMITNPDVLYFDEFAGNDLVMEFKLANGSTNTTDKWSVNSIQVQFVAPNSKLELDADSLSLELVDPAAAVDGTLTASIGLGFNTNDVDILSLTADSGFSAEISGTVLSTVNTQEIITVSYTNTGALVYNGDSAASTLSVVWEAVGSGVISTNEVALDVTFSAEEPEQTVIDIYAAADTTYGTDVIATMISATQTVGLATFQIAFDVEPMDGAAIDSGTSGGVSSNNSWGVGTDALFKGSDGEYVDGISNLRVTNFNANGGSVTVDDIGYLSFTAVTIVNGQTANKDSVQVIVNGSVTNDLGSLGGTPYEVDLKDAGGVGFVTDFALGANSDSIYNKWSVYSIQVGYASPDMDGYAGWAADYGLTGDDALAGADVENGGAGDGYDNLAEFALGMDPTVSDAGTMEFVGTVEDGGISYLEYVHPRRTSYIEDGLTYNLIESADLGLDSGAVTNSQDQIFVGAATNGYETVTNRYLIDDAAKFIELEVKQD